MTTSLLLISAGWLVAAALLAVPLGRLLAARASTSPAAVSPEAAVGDPPPPRLRPHSPPGVRGGGAHSP